MDNYLVIGTDKKKAFRAYAANTRELVEEGRNRHNTSATATAALGRALTAGVLLSANLKGEDLLSLRICGDGPLGVIVVTTDADGYVRGYVQCPQADLPSRNGKLDVGGLVGREGQFSVTKNLGLREPYTGSTQLVSGEIGEDLAYYLATSEQIPSVVALGVLVDTDLSVRAAGGYMVQALPGAEEADLTALEERACQLPNVSTLFDQGISPEEILRMLLGEDFMELEKKPVKFRCLCSKERLERILVSLGEEEIQEIINTQDRAEIKCHFCAEKYYFEGHELKEILKEAKKQ